eukprot:1842502-Rhodomonas_salina.1
MIQVETSLSECQWGPTAAELAAAGRSFIMILVLSRGPEVTGRCQWTRRAPARVTPGIIITRDRGSGAALAP